MKRTIGNARAIVLFGVPEPIRSACETLAVETGLAFADSRNLLAACRALGRHPQAMVVGSHLLRSWDREVFEGHVQQQKLLAYWTQPDDDAESVTSQIRRWIRESSRPLAQSV